MEGINKIFCGTDVKNTGVCDCFFDPKLLNGGLLVPKDRVYTEEELKDENIQATFEADIAAGRAVRVFPLPSFNGITDNSGDPTRQTFGYGSLETVREGDYDWTLGFRRGGVNLSNNLRSFNGLTGKYRLILFESQNTVIGTSRKDANGENGLGGIPLEDLYTRPWKAGDGTNLTGYAMNVVFHPQYINELIAFKKVAVTSLLLSELTGLEDIKLTIVEADEAADTVLVTAATDCGSTDVWDLFENELEEDTAWIVKGADGVVKEVTVAKDTDAKGWLLTYTTDEVEDGDTITLAAPAVLAEAPINISGYESDTVTVELGS